MDGHAPAAVARSPCAAMAAERAYARGRHATTTTGHATHVTRWGTPAQAGMGRIALLRTSAAVIDGCLETVALLTRCVLVQRLSDGLFAAVSPRIQVDFVSSSVTVLLSLSRVCMRALPSFLSQSPQPLCRACVAWRRAVLGSCSFVCACSAPSSIGLRVGAFLDRLVCSPVSLRGTRLSSLSPASHLEPIDLPAHTRTRKCPPLLLPPPRLSSLSQNTPHTAAHSRREQ